MTSTPMARACIAVALAASLTAAVPARAGDAGGIGRAFTLKVRETRSARAAFREMIGMLRRDRLKGLAVRSAVTDRGDRFVQGFIEARYDGTAVSGVLVAGTGGVAGGVIDTPDRLPRRYASLMRQLQRMLPSRGSGSPGGGAVEPLHTVSFGSGAIGLPATWQVTNSYQGCVEAASLHDHGYIALGCPQHAVVPPGLPGTNPRVQLVAPFSSPVRILGTVMTEPAPVRLGAQSFHAVEVKPVESGLPHGQAAYVLFDYRVNGVPFRGLAMVSIAPYDAMSFMVYKSMFMLPADAFPRLAPTMWRSWQSWGVNSGVLTGRLVSAAQSMRETGDIISGAYWERQHANATTSMAFDQYIRDTATVEDIPTGRRYDGSYRDAAAIVEHDPTKYRIVPTSELIPR